MAEDPRDMTEMFSIYRMQEGIHSNEGERGLTNFDKVAKMLGYTDRDHFLRDNSGAIDMIFDWIQESMDPDWEDKVRKAIPAYQEETEEELEHQMDEMMDRAMTILRDRR